MIPTRNETPPRENLSYKNMSRIGIPSLFHDSEISDYRGHDDIKKLMTRYIANIHDMFQECINVTFYGSNGNGKTFLSSLILKNAYRYRYTARRVTLTHLIDMVFKPNKTDEELLEIKQVYDAEFLAIDEIGKEPNIKSGNNIVVFEELMKHREELGYPTILCMNLNLSDLKERYGKTIDSLVKYSVKLEMDGDDLRDEVFRKKSAISKLFEEDDDQ